MLQRVAAGSWMMFALLGLGCATSPPAPQEPQSGEEQTADPSPTASEGDTSRPSTGVPPNEPARVWTEFVQDFNSGDAGRLARWSAPGGVLLLDNPGAFVRVRVLPDAPSLMTQEGEFDGARIKKAKLNENVSLAAAPVTNCETDETPRVGVFLSSSDGARLEKMIDAMGKYDLAAAEEVAKLRAVFDSAAKESLFSVTDTEQSLAFYFSVGSDRVTLLAVDAVIPCSA